jgi:hypothetical protein
MAACPRCRSADLVRIDLRPGGGLLRFSACRNCEHRWWVRPGDHETVRLPDVVEAVAVAER